MPKLKSTRSVIGLSEFHVVELQTEFTNCLSVSHFLFFPLFFFFFDRADTSHLSCPNGAMGKNAYP